MSRFQTSCFDQVCDRGEEFQPTVEKWNVVTKLGEIFGDFPRMSWHCLSKILDLSVKLACPFVVSGASLLQRLSCYHRIVDERQQEEAAEAWERLIWSWFRANSDRRDKADDALPESSTRRDQTSRQRPQHDSTSRFDSLSHQKKKWEMNVKTLADACLIDQQDLAKLHNISCPTLASDESDAHATFTLCLFQCDNALNYEMMRGQAYRLFRTALQMHGSASRCSKCGMDSTTKREQPICKQQTELTRDFYAQLVTLFVSLDMVNSVELVLDIIQNKKISQTVYYMIFHLISILRVAQTRAYNVDRALRSCLVTFPASLFALVTAYLPGLRSVEFWNQWLAIVNNHPSVFRNNEFRAK